MLFLVIFHFFSANIFSGEISVAYINTHDEKNIKRFIQGLESTQIKIIHLKKIKNKNFNYLITLDTDEYIKFLNLQVKIFAAFINEKNLNKNIPGNLIGALIDKYPFRKIFLTVKKIFPNINSIGIVLHNYDMIKSIANTMVYQPLIRIYEVNKKSKILYKYRKAIEQNDFIIIFPDEFVINYFTFSKILKMLNENEKNFAGYSKLFLKYGANLVFEIDYFKEGKIVGNYLKNYKNGFKKFYTDNLIIKINNE